MVSMMRQVDTLELVLREQEEVVDKIFLVETVLTHRGVSTKSKTTPSFGHQKRKPLMWERLKFTERFSFVNQSKVGGGREEGKPP